MPEPRVTYLVVGSEGLGATIASLEQEGGQGRSAALFATPDSVSPLLKSRRDGPFGGVTAGGLPLTALADDGKTPEAEAYNALLREALPHSDLVIFLRAGDRILPGLTRAAAAAILEDPSQVGACYPDVFRGGVREFPEPFDRRRLLATFTAPEPLCISAAAIARIGLLDPRASPCHFFDMLVRITEHFIATHLPSPLAYLPRREMPPASELRASWEYVLGRTNQRAA